MKEFIFVELLNWVVFRLSLNTGGESGERRQDLITYLRNVKSDKVPLLPWDVSLILLSLHSQILELNIRVSVEKGIEQPISEVMMVLEGNVAYSEDDQSTWA